jgi:transcriptional regulator
MEECMFSPELKKGSMELLILSMLKDQSRHGYEIGKLIELRSEGQLEFRVSSLYSILYRMEHKGWISGRWVEKEGQRRRCYYSLTPTGQKILVQQREDWQAFSAVINRVIGLDHA